MYTYPMGSIGSGINLTHVDTSKIAPSFTAKQSFYSEDITVKLLSLSQLQKNGGAYYALGTDRLVIMDDKGDIIDIAHVQPNGLYPVTVPSTSKSFYCSCCFSAYPAPATNQILYPDTSNNPVSVNHISSARRERANRAEELHSGQGVHASDDVFRATLANGGFPDTHLVPADVTLNRQLRGKCPSSALVCLLLLPYLLLMLHKKFILTCIEQTQIPQLENTLVSVIMMKCLEILDSTKPKKIVNLSTYSML